MGARCPEPTPLILFLPQVDGGWIDLLEAGAFDLVAEPYTAREDSAGYRRAGTGRTRALASRAVAHKPRRGRP